MVLSLGRTSTAQFERRNPQPTAIQNQAEIDSPQDEAREDPKGEAELQTGTTLTRQGKFSEAIPHLLAARGHVSNEYAASFNLALCYVGTEQYERAISVLNNLRQGRGSNADVENLLAQAYIGAGQSQHGFEAFQRAAALTPANEKLYVFIADACMGSHDYSLGLKVVESGLRNLPQSAALHYERGIFLTHLDEFDRARKDFELATQLAPASEISYLASANKELYAGNPQQAARDAREGISKGYGHPVLLAILGESLIRCGARPGDADFSEAQAALEKSVALNSRNPSAQVSLGSVYLMADRPADAIAHLERARQLEPGNPAVYAGLAKAYQRRGDSEHAQQALATLAKLNQAQAEKIASAPGDRKAGYAGTGSEESRTPEHP
jgi:tetratricopeptide (TPR) repeat protein